MKKVQINRIRLGLNIRMRRHVMRMTQAELAKKVGCTSQTISAMERGKRAISVENLFALCHALEYTVNDLLRGAE